MALTIVTDDDFEASVLGADKPVIISFGAEWCQPCKQMAPQLTKLAEEAAGDFIVAKMDVDESPDTAGSYGLRGVPTLMIFVNGEMISSHTGAMSKSQIRDWLNKNTAADATSPA